MVNLLLLGKSTLFFFIFLLLLLHLLDHVALLLLPRALFDLGLAHLFPLDNAILEIDKVLFILFALLEMRANQPLQIEQIALKFCPGELVELVRFLLD